MGNRTTQAFNEHRRTFLRSLGLAAGAAALNPMGLVGGTHPHAQGLHPSIGRLPRIGLVMPGASSSGYSGGHFTAGFTCYLDEAFGRAGVKTRLIVDEGEKHPHKAVRQIAAMIASGTVDVVVAPVNPSSAVRLHSVLEARKTILINVDTGANVVRERERSPFVFHSSLSHWQATMALGRHAVARYGKNVMIASSVNESGYDALFTFRLGVEASGGTIVDTHVANGASAAADMKAAIERIRIVNPDVVYAMYNGADAEAFLKLYSQTGLSRRIPLVASPFTLADAVLRTQGVHAEGIRTCGAWSRELATAANRAFDERYEAHAHHRADAFSVLGYDTARLIVEAVRASGAVTGSELADGLCLAAFDGPRGTVTMNVRTRSVETPVYLCEVRGGGRGSVHAVTEKIEAGRDEHHSSIAALEMEMRTGLSYSYLTA